MKISPREDHVLVHPIDPEAKTPGGILLPDVARSKSQRGVVVASGPGRWTESGVLIKTGLERDDTVIYAKYAGVQVEIDGEKLMLMRAGEVLAKISEE